MRNFTTALSAAAAASLFALMPPLAGLAQSDQGVMPLKVAKAPVDTSRFAADHRLFADAMDAYRGGRWSAAYGRFIVLADLGHPYAARMAMQMYLHGPTQYGTQWDATQEQLEQWPIVEARLNPPPQAEPAAMLQASHAPGE